MNDDKIFIGLVACIAMGLNFGMWAQNINAGLVGGLATWLAFCFKYD